MRGEIGINKNDPEAVLFRRADCPGGNECKHHPVRCAIQWDTYNWHEVSTPE